MAKSRAQRKAEQRKREERLRQQAREAQAKARGAAPDAIDESIESSDHPESDAPAPRRPPEYGDTGPVDPVAEAELVSAAPVKRSRREERREAKERERRARESAKRREGVERTVKERGAVSGFFASVWRELQRVQWPDRDTLVQASAVTILFVAIAAAYLGALDAAFNEVIKFII